MKFLTSFLRRYRNIFLGLGILLLLHTLIRIIFWMHNLSQFPEPQPGESIRIFLSGLEQDLVTILLVNSIPFFVLVIAPLFPSSPRWIYRYTRWIFVLANSLAFALNLLDAGYFRFSRHRANLDLFYVLADSLGSLPSLVLGYGWFFLLFAILVFILVRMGRSLFSIRDQGNLARTRRWVQPVLFVLLYIFLMGGFIRTRILPSTPLLYIEAVHLPIAQNSLYTLFYSTMKKQKQLKQKNYFSQQALDSLVQLVHRMKSEEPMQRKNIVLCILESFDRGYLLPGDKQKAVTPFFDSLLKKSIFFTNAYANGYSSNQGIVAILAGLPAFLEEPFYYSAYANTPLRGIANILKEKGYNTNFLMGAAKDHFGFEKFARLAGIDHSYSRDDYNREQDYDGNWGIFDEPFLQYGSRILAKKPQPFMAVFYNISSHPPFTIPEEHRKQFGYPDQSPEQRAVSYVDYSFRKFFESCQKEAWFKNSLFIFCSDHYLSPAKGSYNRVASTAIPMFIYDPSATRGRMDSTLCSQVDLTPCILGQLNYSGTYTGFGKDILHEPAGEQYVLNKPGQIYQLISGEYVLGYDADREKTEYFYHYASDRSLELNLADSPNYSEPKRKMLNFLQASIQRYNGALIRRILE